MDRQTILVADSSEEFRIAVKQALQKQFRVLCCQDGKQALALLRRENCRLLILDLMLPELDGITLLETALSEGIRPTVLVTTLLVNPYIEQALQRLPVSYAVRKPCELSALTSRVLDLCGQLPVVDPSQEDQRFLTGIFQQLGLVSKHRGYQYLIKCILSSAAEPNISYTKILYPEVGKPFQRTGRQVERSIRSALDYGWEHGPREVWLQYFPSSEKRPASSDFITRMAELLRQRRE